MIAYTYNKAARQYVGPSGRFVPRAEIRSALDAVIEVAQAELRATALRLQSGEIDLNSWFYASAAQIKRIIIASGTLAVGGPHGLTPRVLGSLGNDVKRQLAYLSDFARELENGLPLDGRFLARIASYGDAGRVTYEAITRKADIAAGMKWERRVLGASDASCKACRDEAAKGWQPAGKLAAIGLLTCLGNCRCSFERAAKRPSGIAAMSAGTLRVASRLADVFASLVAFSGRRNRRKHRDRRGRSRPGGKAPGNCGTGYGGFIPGNTCGRRSGRIEPDEPREIRAAVKRPGSFRPAPVVVQGPHAYPGDPNSVGSHIDLGDPGPHHAVFGRALDAIHAVHGDGGLPNVVGRADPSISRTNLAEYRSPPFGEGGSISLRTPRSADLEFHIAHEIGHYLDHRGLGEPGEFASESMHPEVQSVMRAILKSPEGVILTRKSSSDSPARSGLAYLALPSERFARAYAQYIAHRGGDPAMRAGLRSLGLSPYGMMERWSDKNFEPIAKEFDALFRAKGWSRGG